MPPKQQKQVGKGRPLECWLEIVKKLAKGVSPDIIAQEYDVAKTTVYKLKEKGEKQSYAKMIPLFAKGVTEEDAREWLKEDGGDLGHQLQSDQEIAATSPGIVVPSAGADVTAARADVEDLEATDAEPIPNLSVICNAADILLTYLDHKDCPAVFRPQLYDELQLMREKLDRFLKCPPAPTTSTPLPNLTLADDPDEPLPTSPQPGFSGYFPTRSRFSDEESDIFSPKKLPRLKAPHFPSSDEESDLFSSEKLPRLKAPHFSSSDETE